MSLFLVIDFPYSSASPSIQLISFQQPLSRLFYYYNFTLSPLPLHPVAYLFCISFQNSLLFSLYISLHLSTYIFKKPLFCYFLQLLFSSSSYTQYISFLPHNHIYDIINQSFGSSCASCFFHVYFCISLCWKQVSVKNNPSSTQASTNL